MLARIFSAIRGRLGSASPWNAIGLVALAIACLTPALGTGYISDDNITSLTPGMIRYAKIDLPTWIGNAMKTSIRDGRFFPLAWPELHGVFGLITDVHQYKWFVVGLVVADLLLFAALVGKVGGDGGLAWLAASLAVLGFQLRAYHDPILSFAGMPQLVVAELMLSLLALERYFDGRGRRWLAASALLYLANCLMYEASYPFFLMHAALAWRRRPGIRAWLGASLPFVGMAIGCVAVSLAVRRLPTAGASAYAMNPRPGAVLATMARQTSAAFPLSYFAADPANLFWNVKSPGALANWLSTPGSIGIILAASAVCYLALRRRAVEQAGDGLGRLRLAGLGAALAVLPGALISVTERYQAQVTIGKGYVPVFIQYFGVALLLATAIRTLLSKIRPGIWAIGSKVAVAGTVGAATALTYLSNGATAISLVSPPGTASFNDTAFGMGGGYAFHRMNLEAALDSGLMDEVPEDAKVFLSSEYPWWYEGLFSAFFIAQHTDKIFITVPPSARDLASPKAEFLRKVLAQRKVVAGPGYVLRDVCTGPESGYVVLSREGDAGDLRLFVRQPHLISRSRPTPGFLVAGDSGGGIPFVKKARDLRILKSGRDWVLLGLKGDPGAVFADSIRPVFDRAEGARLAEAGGKKGVISR